MGHIKYPRARSWQIKALVPGAHRRKAHSAEQAPPSWSWMASSGGIEYLALTNVAWDLDLRLENEATVLRARVAPLEGCGRIKAEDPVESLAVYDDRDRLMARFWFDDPTRVSAVKHGCLFLGNAEVYCALLGKPQKTSNSPGEHCVLAVARVHRVRSTKFERIGIGFVTESSVEFDPESFSSVI